MVYNGSGSFSIQVCFTTLADNVENKSKCPWTERAIFFPRSNCVYNGENYYC